MSIIPIITSKEGASLTFANWLEAGVEKVACYLSDLLIKPGIQLLKERPLKQYISWPGEIALNLDGLKANDEGVIKIRSPYDGSIISTTTSEILALVISLKPEKVIIPERFCNKMNDFLEQIPKEIFVYVSEKCLPINSKKTYGIYLRYQHQDFTEFLEVIKSYRDYSCYVSGDFDFYALERLKEKKVSIETDFLAKEGVQGFVISQGNLVDLKDEAYSLDFEKIDNACQCPSCNLNFTKAYLHHLYFNTPLLCHRLLIQHNAWNL
ncbi:queuine tRNA-ribosyltransferase (plasmid) [Legionella adelaidensis]|uniref:Queuine tRNA-ribosyltransferase n=1 Tax=Legionella adelaidensis TaxID=45056 RepID=A0A0W0R1I1_9GAMM|nr:hypothetical protein [Legionella adelaidensis]KTC64940.1 queuine tRNA-ribosyltransferase [Legionella adelaidensis]VEH85623.1 queuine tRNA-ribosyltransferase [Legionella adelaidensis]